MNSTQESQEVVVDLVDFSKTVTEQLVEFECANYLTSNFTERGYAKGLKTYTCACGAHSFAAAFDDKIDAWVRHQRMHPALRKHVEEKIGAPERPPPAPVILIDVDDEHFLRERRWKVWRSQRGHRAKWYLQQGRRSKTLQRVMFPNAECVEILNANGLDLRRCNLRCTTIKVLLRERNKRRGWQNDSARAKAWNDKVRAKKQAAKKVEKTAA